VQITHRASKLEQELEAVRDPARELRRVSSAQRECRLGHRLEWFEPVLLDPTGRDEIAGRDGRLRCERVHGDSLSFGFARCGNRHPVERRLRRSVASARLRRSARGERRAGRQFAREARQVDDPAAAPIPHPREHCLHQLPGSPYVDLHEPLEIGRRPLIDGLVAVRRRTVHEDVDRPERNLGALDEARALAVGVGEVGGQDERRAPHLSDELGRFFEPFPAACRDRDLRAFRREPHRDRRSGATLAGARHERDAPLAGPFPRLLAHRACSFT
jgi:hypothetical protein